MLDVCRCLVVHHLPADRDLVAARVIPDGRGDRLRPLELPAGPRRLRADKQKHEHQTNGPHGPTLPAWRPFLSRVPVPISGFGSLNLRDDPAVVGATQATDL